MKHKTRKSLREKTFNAKHTIHAYMCKMIKILYALAMSNMVWYDAINKILISIKIAK